MAVVNLDPANDRLPYPCDIDVSELVSLSRVMETLSLGPNGGLLYCMEYLDAHVDWLVERLAALGRVRYILFDCPGQVELYAHHGSFKRILERLDKAGYRVRNWACCRVSLTAPLVGCRASGGRGAHHG